MSNNHIDKTLVYSQDRLHKTLIDLPSNPGCYLFKDKLDNLLYIGKSKNIKSRVRSYFRKNNDLTARISLMIRQIYEIEFIITDSETEALTLESNLIKVHQPYFNILLKDDKKYPYVCITWSDSYPRIFITRKRRQRSDKDRYYGPYVDVTLLRNTLTLIKRLFPLRQRPVPLYKDRTCLNYSIGRCPGVCQSIISEDDYKKTITTVAMIFQGRTDELEKRLESQMIEYSNQQLFEKAGLIRDQIKGLKQLAVRQKMINPDSSINRDVIAMDSNDSICSIQIFQIRAGKIVGRLGYNTDSSNLKEETILQKIIEDHYSNLDSVEIPPQILIELEIPQLKYIEDWLSELRKHTVKLKVPKRSSNSKLINLVKKNASFELNRILKGKERINLEIEDLTNILSLDQCPKRIEGYDISHIQGSDAVGSQVVFIDGIPAKQHYRKYNIKDSSVYTGHSDDYKSLEEVIRRRFRRWAEYKNQGIDLHNIKNSRKSSLNPILISDWPDLIMIDGGKGQLSSVMEVLREINLDSDINVCSLAKKNEDIFLPGLDTPLYTEKDQFGLLLLRRLRDEAHRYALFSHRSKRSSNSKRSQLLAIPGVGSKKIKLLLAHFNSIQAIQLATIEQISEVSGFGKLTANKVWQYFHPDN